MVLRKRVRQYFNYFDAQYWQDHTDLSFPEIILVAPDMRSKNYLKRFIKKMLEEENENVIVLLSTWDEIKQKGMCREVLQRVELE